MADYELKWEGYQEHYAKQSTAACEVTCAWSDRQGVIGQLMYTVHSDMPWLVCMDATPKPEGDADPINGGPKTARIALAYEDPRVKPELPNSDMSTWKEHWEGSGEAVTLGVGFQWSDLAAEGDAVNKAIKDDDGVSTVKIIPQATIAISGSTKKSIVLGKTAIKNCMGKVNSGNVTIKKFVYSDQTLMFHGVDFDESQGPDGSDVNAITFKFQAMFDHTWNQVWRKKTPGGKTQGWYNVIDMNNLPPYTKCQMSDVDPKYW